MKKIFIASDSYCGEITGFVILRNDKGSFFLAAVVQGLKEVLPLVPFETAEAARDEMKRYGVRIIDPKTDRLVFNFLTR